MLFNGLLPSARSGACFFGAFQRGQDWKEGKFVSFLEFLMQQHGANRICLHPPCIPLLHSCLKFIAKSCFTPLHQEHHSRENSFKACHLLTLITIIDFSRLRQFKFSETTLALRLFLHTFLFESWLQWQFQQNHQLSIFIVRQTFTLVGL